MRRMTLPELNTICVYTYAYIKLYVLFFGKYVA